MTCCALQAITEGNQLKPWFVCAPQIAMAALAADKAAAEAAAGELRRELAAVRRTLSDAELAALRGAPANGPLAGPSHATFKADPAEAPLSAAAPGGTTDGPRAEPDDACAPEAAPERAVKRVGSGCSAGDVGRAAARASAEAAAAQEAAAKRRALDALNALRRTACSPGPNPSPTIAPLGGCAPAKPAAGAEPVSGTGTAAASFQMAASQRAVEATLHERVAAERDAARADAACLAAELAELQATLVALRPDPYLSPISAPASSHAPVAAPRVLHADASTCTAEEWGIGLGQGAAQTASGVPVATSEREMQAGVPELTPPRPLADVAELDTQAGSTELAPTLARASAAEMEAAVRAAGARARRAAAELAVAEEKAARASGALASAAWASHNPSPSPGPSDLAADEAEAARAAAAARAHDQVRQHSETLPYPIKGRTCAQVQVLMGTCNTPHEVPHVALFSRVFSATRRRLNSGQTRSFACVFACLRRTAEIVKTHFPVLAVTIEHQ